eukprot:SM000073S21494  [mRNA]  locus=s73:619422:622533:- [translate_table: standard]
MRGSGSPGRPATLRNCKELAASQGLEEGAARQQLRLLEDALDLLTSDEERRLYDWALERQGNSGGQYVWPYEADITQSQVQGTPPRKGITHNTYDIPKLVGSDAEASADASSGGVRAGHKGVCTKVDVQEGGLPSFHQDALSVSGMSQLSEVRGTPALARLPSLPSDGADVYDLPATVRWKGAAAGLPQPKGHTLEA